VQKTFMIQKTDHSQPVSWFLSLTDDEGDECDRIYL